MQLVSDLQQRPKKGRLKIEKRIVLLYDLCSVVQFTVFLIHTVTTMIGANRTFQRSIIVNNEFKLAPAIVFKTRNCIYSTSRSIYAFQDVNMTFTPSSVNDVFVDQAIQMRLAIFICVVTFVVGGVNRMMVEMNLFVVKYRNFYFWKDIVSATELILLAYVAQIAAAVSPPKNLLHDYLRHCGIEGNAYLPFISTVNLWVFVGVGYFTYALGLAIYLNNTTPKYGIMTPQEIEEYKAWLRARRAEHEQSRLLIEEARKAHARIHMMSTADYRIGSEMPVVAAPMMPPYPYPMMPGAGPNQMAYPQPYPYPYPYPFPYGGYQGLMPPPLPPPSMAMPDAGMPGGGHHLPPPQMFGAGMMLPQSPMQYDMAPEMVPGAALPVNDAPQPPINMPRRRIVPNMAHGNSTVYQ